MELHQFTRMGAKDRNETVKRLNLCFCCLIAGHRGDQCNLKRGSGKDGRTRRHKRLLHRDGNEPANSQLTDNGANPILTPNACSGILQVVSVKFSSGVNSVDTLAVCDIGSTSTFVDSGIKSWLGLD